MLIGYGRPVLLLSILVVTCNFSPIANICRLRLCGIVTSNLLSHRFRPLVSNWHVRVAREALTAFYNSDSDRLLAKTACFGKSP